MVIKAAFRAGFLSKRPLPTPCGISMCSEFPYILFERLFKSFNATIADFFNIQVEREQGDP